MHPTGSKPEVFSPKSVYTSTKYLIDKKLYEFICPLQNLKKQGIGLLKASRLNFLIDFDNDIPIRLLKVPAIFKNSSPYPSLFNFDCPVLLSSNSSPVLKSFSVFIVSNSLLFKGKLFDSSLVKISQHIANELLYLTIEEKDSSRTNLAIIGPEFVFEGLGNDSRPAKTGVVVSGYIKLQGFSYCGSIEEGQLNGIAKAVFSNGEMYSGEWKNNRFEGRGMYWYTKREYYCGSFVNGKKHGQGMMKMANGDRFEGGWENDKANGEGKLIEVGGAEYAGKWVEDRLIRR
jgi:hypothetical protein